jgi:hypothetical protein
MKQIFLLIICSLPFSVSSLAQTPETFDKSFQFRVQRFLDPVIFRLSANSKLGTRNGFQVR